MRSQPTKIDIMEQIRRRLAIILIALVVTLGGGTLGFVLIEHYSVFDAFYMTLTTVTTVGSGELHPLSHVGRMFNAGLILVGVITLLLAVGAMTQTIVELELTHFFDKRKVKGMISKLEGHIIVCGFGRVGQGAADELGQAGVPFVVVDMDEDRVERAMRAGMLGVVADVSADETLLEIGINRARGLIATLATDADNLFLVMTAKALNPRLQLSARVNEESSEEKLRRAGADFVIAPHHSTGHRMAQAIVRPHLQQFLDFTTRSDIGLKVGIEQVQVGHRCAFAGKSLEDMAIRRDTGVIVLAIRRASGEMLFNPPPEATVTSGDHLIAMGEPQGLRKLENVLMGVPA
jgi:voltage-gated potassium channel